jgi:hypothetical protein
MGRQIAFACLVAGAVLSVPGPVLGRGVEAWPIDKLFKEADFAIIGRWVSIADAGKEIRDKPIAKYLKPVVSVLQVDQVLKGDVGDKRIKILHHRIDNQYPEPIINGPRLIEFHGNRLKVADSFGAVRVFHPPQYMVFLKKRPDGLYECVSRFDEETSVKQIIVPLPKR